MAIYLIVIKAFYVMQRETAQNSMTVVASRWVYDDRGLLTYEERVAVM